MFQCLNRNNFFSHILNITDIHLLQLDRWLELAKKKHVYIHPYVVTLSSLRLEAGDAVRHLVIAPDSLCVHCAWKKR